MGANHTPLPVRIIERRVPRMSSSLHPNALVHRLLAARGVTDVA